MIKTQTIVTTIEQAFANQIDRKINEETGEEEEYFVSSKFDQDIEEFCISVAENGGQVFFPFTFLSSQEHLIAIISYSDVAIDSKIQKPSSLNLNVTPQ